jgi:tetratricopeptide (TPR) repeat protein
VRETLYEDLPFPRRVELHRRAAGVLLRGNQRENVDELARHFLRAAAGGDVERAVTWALRAGDRAMECLAYEAASDTYARALTAIREAPSLPGSADAWQRHRIEILTRLGNAYVRAGDSAAADNAFLDALARARAIEDGPLMAHAALGLGQVRFERGRSDLALQQWLEESLARLGPASSALRYRARFSRRPPATPAVSSSRRLRRSDGPSHVTAHVADRYGRCCGPRSRPHDTESGRRAAHHQRAARQPAGAQAIGRSSRNSHLRRHADAPPARSRRRARPSPPSWERRAAHRPR